MLSIHASRYPDQASASLLAQIRERLAAGRRVYLVVPSQATVETELALFQALDVDSMMLLQVKSFHSLEREILEAGQGLKIPRLSKIGRSILLRLLLEDRPLEAFAPGSRGRGFVERLSSEIQEFKEYAISPEVLEAMAARLAPASHTAVKFRELAELFRAYEQALEDSWMDRDDGLRYAIEQIGMLSVFDEVDFFFDHFLSMSTVESELILQLLQKGKDVHLAFTLDAALAKEVLATGGQIAAREGLRERWMGVVPDADVFSLTANYLFRLLHEANERGQGAARLFDSQGFPGNPPAVIAQAAAAVFSYRSTATPLPEGTTSLQLRSYRNAEDEVDGVISAIRQAIRSGRRYRDIQLVVTEPSEYFFDLRRKLRWEGIPYFLDEVRSVQYKPLIRLITSTLDLLQYNARRKDVIAWLSTGLSGLSDEEEQSYRRFITQRNIDRGMFHSLRYFTLSEDYAREEPARREEAEAVFAKARAIQERLLGIFSSYRSTVHAERTVEERARDLYAFLSQEVLTTRLQQWETELLESNRREEWEENRQLWQCVMDLLDQLVEIGGQRPCSFALFADLVREGLETISVGIIPPYQDQVLISTLLRSRANTRPLVFLLGAGDVYLPGAHKEPDVLSAEEKELFRALGYELPSMAHFAAQEEALSFYIAVVKTGERLVISYAAQNRAQEAVAQSFWTQRMQEAFCPDAQGRGGLPLEIIDRLPLEEQLHARSQLVVSVPEWIRSEQPEIRDWGLRVLQGMEESEALRSQAQAIRRGLEYQNRRDPLPASVVQALYSSDRVSVSQLERYAQCPYEYFVRYGLRPERLERFALEAAELGTLLHASLDRWTEKAAEDPKALRDVELEQARQVVEEAFEAAKANEIDALRQEDAQNRFVLALTEKTLREAHDRFFFQLKNSAVDRIYHEESFGRGGVFPPFLLQVGKRAVRIEGRMDRVDALDVRAQGKTYWQVIDYKTGQRAFALSRVLGGLDLQLVLYLGAVCQSPQAEPFGCFYAPVTPPTSLSEQQDVAAEAAKEGRLDGVLLGDLNILSQMDFTMAKTEESSLLSAIYELRGRKSDPLERENVLQRKELRALLEEAVRLATQLLERRDAGEIEVRPYRLEEQRVQTGCDFCKLQALCRFEKARDFKKYRRIPSVGWVEWKKAQDTLPDESDAQEDSL